MIMFFLRVKAMVLVVRLFVARKGGGEFHFIEAMYPDVFRQKREQRCIVVPSFTFLYT